MKNFPGPFQSPWNSWMCKYIEKMAFTYNIQSVIHCRKLSMKQNVYVSCSEFWWTYLVVFHLMPEFSGLSRSWNFQEKKSRTFQEAWEPCQIHWRKILLHKAQWTFEHISIYSTSAVNTQLHCKNTSKLHLQNTDQIHTCLEYMSDRCAVISWVTSNTKDLDLMLNDSSTTDTTLLLCESPSAKIHCFCPSLLSEWFRRHHWLGNW